MQELVARYERSVNDIKTTHKEYTIKILQILAEINALIRMRMCATDSYSFVPDEVAAPQIGKLRVGRIKGNTEPGKKIPVTDDYMNIIVTSHNQKGLGHSLSPYVLTDSKGRIMENLWQFSKIYANVTKQTQPNWQWENETHAVKDTFGKYVPTEDYWLWRQSGMEHDKPVRYPNGFRGKAECLHILWPTDESRLYDPNVKMNQYGYIESRKKVYCKLYASMVKDNLEFKKLQQMLQSGINLQILDVDGPDVDKATDKKGTIKAPYNTMPVGIFGDTSGVGSIEINETNIKLLMLDTDQPFGHGYVLACLLLGKEEWLN